TMWQLSEAVDGMGEACRALSLPVVGGNVSLYNESRGRDIDPTPGGAVVGRGVGARGAPPPGVGLVDGTLVVAVGPEPSTLSGSAWSWRRGHKAGRPPALDLAAHRAVGALVRDLGAAGRRRPPAPRCVGCAASPGPASWPPSTRPGRPRSPGGPRPPGWRWRCWARRGGAGWGGSGPRGGGLARRRAAGGGGWGGR